MKDIGLNIKELKKYYKNIIIILFLLKNNYIYIDIVHNLLFLILMNSEKVSNSNFES